MPTEPARLRRSSFSMMSMRFRARRPTASVARIRPGIQRINCSLADPRDEGRDLWKES